MMKSTETVVIIKIKGITREGEPVNLLACTITVETSSGREAAIEFELGQSNIIPNVSNFNSCTDQK